MSALKGLSFLFLIVFVSVANAELNVQALEAQEKDHKVNESDPATFHFSPELTFDGYSVTADQLMVYPGKHIKMKLIDGEGYTSEIVYYNEETGGLEYIHPASGKRLPLELRTEKEIETDEKLDTPGRKVWARQVSRFIRQYIHLVQQRQPENAVKLIEHYTGLKGPGTNEVEAHAPAELSEDSEQAPKYSVNTHDGKPGLFAGGRPFGELSFGDDGPTDEEKVKFFQNPSSTKVQTCSGEACEFKDIPEFAKLVLEKEEPKPSSPSSNSTGYEIPDLDEQIAQAHSEGKKFFVAVSGNLVGCGPCRLYEASTVGPIMSAHPEAKIHHNTIEMSEISSTTGTIPFTQVYKIDEDGTGTLLESLGGVQSQATLKNLFNQ